MSDNTSKRGGQDRSRIDVHEAHELRDWSKKLGFSQYQLKEGVKAVGNDAKKVEAHLRERGGNAK